MTIFGNSTLGRLGYAIMILLMLTFDFAKAPIERYLVRQHDLAAEELMAPRPVVASPPRRRQRSMVARCPSCSRFMRTSSAIWPNPAAR